MTRRYAEKERVLNNKATGIINEVLSSLKIVVAYNGQNREINRYNKLIDMLQKLTTKKGFILGLTSGLSGFFNSAGYIVYIGYGTYLQTYESDVFNAGLVMQVN